MTDLATLVVKLEAQTAQFQAALEGANRKLDKFARDTNKNLSTIEKIQKGAFDRLSKSALVSATALGNFLGQAAYNAARAFVRMAGDAIDSADKLGKMSQSTGIATESLSQLEYAAALSDVSLEDLSTRLGKFGKNAVDAAKGSKAAADAFKQLDISVRDSDGSLRPTEDLLLDVADRFSKLEDGAAKAAIAQQLFGRNAQSMIPFLNQGREGIEKLRKEADAFGLTVNAKTAAAAEQFNDNLTRMSFATRGLVNQFIEGAIPTLTAISERFVNAASESGSLGRAIDGLVVIFKGLVSAGSIVTAVFDRVGESIGANTAALVQAAQGNFREAFAILSEESAEGEKDMRAFVDELQAIWSDEVPAAVSAGTGAIAEGLEELEVVASETADKAKTAAERALESLQKLDADLRMQVATFGAAEGAVIAYRLAHGDLAEQLKEAGAAGEQYAKTIQEQTDALQLLRDQQVAEEQIEKINNDIREEGIAVTEEVRTSAEKYADTLERLNLLLEKNAIDQATHDRAAKQAKETLDEADKEVNKFLERANENIQDIIAGGLETALTDGIEAGARGALQAFADMLVKMSAQAVAAHIGSKIFGAGGLGSGEGAIGAAASGIAGGSGGPKWLSSIAKFFGGVMDSGGRGYPGRAYMIGTGAQPEMFVPDAPGTFIPAGAGGMSVNNYFTVVSNDGNVSRRTQAQIGAAAARGLSSANMRGN